MKAGSDRTTRTTAAILSLGLRGRCPNCGRGSLFKGLLDITERCGVCGLSFGGHDAGDAPAVGGIFILGFVVVGLAWGFENYFSPPLWLHAVIWIPLTLVGAVALLRPLKGMTVAMQYKFRALDIEEAGDEEQPPPAI